MVSIQQEYCLKISYTSNIFPNLDNRIELKLWQSKIPNKIMELKEKRYDLKGFRETEKVYNKKGS